MREVSPVRAALLWPAMRHLLPVPLRAAAVLAAALAVALLPLASAPALAQGRGPKPPEGAAPRLNGKPDFSGMWQRPHVPDMTVTTRNRDQVADYAARKGLELTEAERWLGPWLNYDAAGAK